MAAELLHIDLEATVEATLRAESWSNGLTIRHFGLPMMIHKLAASQGLGRSVLWVHQEEISQALDDARARVLGLYYHAGRPGHGDSTLARLEEELSHDLWQPASKRAELWTQLVNQLHQNKALRTILNVPPEFDVPPEYELHLAPLRPRCRVNVLFNRDLAELILSHCTIRGLLAMACVTKEFCRSADDKQLWHPLLRSRHWRTNLVGWQAPLPYDCKKLCVRVHHLRPIIEEEALEASYAVAYEKCEAILPGLAAKLEELEIRQLASTCGLADVLADDPLCTELSELSLIYEHRRDGESQPSCIIHFDLASYSPEELHDPDADDDDFAVPPLLQLPIYRDAVGGLTSVLLMHKRTGKGVWLAKDAELKPLLVDEFLSVCNTTFEDIHPEPREMVRLDVPKLETCKYNLQTNSVRVTRTSDLVNKIGEHCYLGQERLKVPELHQLQIGLAIVNQGRYLCLAINAFDVESYIEDIGNINSFVCGGSSSTDLLSKKGWLDFLPWE